MNTKPICCILKKRKLVQLMVNFFFIHEFCVTNKLIMERILSNAAEQRKIFRDQLITVGDLVDLKD